MIVVLYFVTIIVCTLTRAPLIDNPNRAGRYRVHMAFILAYLSIGFLVLAQLPIVFLFATKNSLLSLLLGPGNGYEKLNYIHRWSGRAMLLCAVIHGSLWIRNHLEYHLPILGQQKETSGVAAFILICIIVLSSLRPVRLYLRQVFFYIQ
jgi:ferric-chelate reductase